MDLIMNNETNWIKTLINDSKARDPPVVKKVRRTKKVIENEIAMKAEKEKIRRKKNDTDNPKRHSCELCQYFTPHKSCITSHLKSKACQEQRDKYVWCNDYKRYFLKADLIS